MRRPDVGLVSERAIFRNRRCPRVLSRRRRFYGKRLFFGALTSEAVRQLSSYQVTWSVKDVHMRICVGDVIEPAALRRNVAYGEFFVVVIPVIVCGLIVDSFQQLDPGNAFASMNTVYNTLPSSYILLA